MLCATKRWNCSQWVDDPMGRQFEVLKAFICCLRRSRARKTTWPAYQGRRSEDGSQIVAASNTRSLRFSTATRAVDRGRRHHAKMVAKISPAGRKRTILFCGRLGCSWLSTASVMLAPRSSRLEGERCCPARSQSVSRDEGARRRLQNGDEFAEKMGWGRGLRNGPKPPSTSCCRQHRRRSRLSL